MKLTDWQGNEYGVGDTVVYPVNTSGSLSLQKATVLDIFNSYYCSDSFRWKKLEENSEPPADTRTEVKVRLQPVGSGSGRFSFRKTDTTQWRDPEGNVISYHEIMTLLEEKHGPQVVSGPTPGSTNVAWMPEDFGYSMETIPAAPNPVVISNICNILYYPEEAIKNSRGN